MPKTRLRANRRVIAIGSNVDQRHLSKADMKAKMDSYNEKVEKYSELPIADLLEMYNENTVGGIYREALVTVIKQKQSESTPKTEEA